MKNTNESLEYWLENAHDLLQEVSADGRFIYVNRAWKNALGYSNDEIKRLSLFDVIHPESLSHCEATFHDLVAGKAVGKIEAVFVAKDGHAIAVEGSCHCRFHRDGPVSIQGIFRDVTERKRLEEQLRQSQKMEALGLLAGGVAHDFGNLLTAISGTLEWMHGDPDSRERRTQGLEQVGESVQNALAITGHLRTFSRGGSGRTVILDLNAAVAKTVKLLERVLVGGIRIKTNLVADPSRVCVGEGHIEQIVMNLALNARDAMPKGGTLRLDTANEAAAGEVGDEGPGSGSSAHVVLSVRDTGCGMDAETRQHVFEPFFTTRAANKGTGLGLSTVFGIVKNAGGSIIVESTPGNGTCFTIRLPTADAGETP